MQYFSDVYKYVLTLCRDEAIAEEVTKETFFKAMRSIDDFKGNCKLYVWLCQIAKNTYFTLSSKQHRITPDFNSTKPSTDLEKQYMDKESASRSFYLRYSLSFYMVF